MYGGHERWEVGIYSRGRHEGVRCAVNRFDRFFRGAETWTRNGVNGENW